MKKKTSANRWLVTTVLLIGVWGGRENIPAFLEVLKSYAAAQPLA